MAIAMRTFGSNLTDLQSGTNADKGLDYQRANAQDAMNQQRLEAFLRLRGQQAAIQAQQNQIASDRAMKMAELLQQNQQFGTQQGNMMKLGELEAKTRLDVAKATGESKGLDPRAFETILAYNTQGQDKVSIARALSAQRRAALDEIKAAKDNATWLSGYMAKPGPLASSFQAQFGRVPDAKAAATRLTAIDTQGASLGLEPDPMTGGFVIPNFNPITPTGLRGAGGGTTPQSGAPTVLQTVQPTLPSADQGQVPAMLQNPGISSGGASDITIGGVPLNGFIDTTPAPEPSAAPVSRFRWTPNGVVAY